LRFLISGAAGFIGSHLCDRLWADGHRIIAVDNLITGSEHNIEHLLGRPRFEFLRHDATQPVRVSGTLDGVWHLASLASPRIIWIIPSRRWNPAPPLRAICWNWRASMTRHFC
jgi:nucleoside-diphosphate-sugar epimerase